MDESSDVIRRGTGAAGAMMEQSLYIVLILVILRPGNNHVSSICSYDWCDGGKIT